MPHAFTFFRAGGFDQVRLATAADLAALGELDRKLWAVLACPVQGHELDERTLALIDSDNDGRVRTPEVLAAVAWTRERLVDLAAIIPGKDRLPLAAIAPAAGAAMLACARRVLEKAGKPALADIGLDELTAASGELAKTRLNGDGVLPVSAAGSAALAAVITDILAVRAGVPDRGGETGLDRAVLDAFLADAASWLAWWDAGQARAAELLPIGEATPAALAAVEAVRAKVDDFFLRCRSAAFDPRAGAQLSRSEADWAAIAATELTATTAGLAAFPLAIVAPGAALSLGGGTNPAWAVALAALRDLAVTPILGARESLDETAWRELNARLEPFRAWRTTEAAVAVGKLGATRLRELSASAVKDELLALFAQDELVKPEFDALNDLERLVRYHRDLYRLLQNFAALSDFYASDRLAVFQAGTLYFDGRSCDLCVRVGDMARHGLLAGKSNTFLLYCDCTRQGEKMTICAAVTNGSSDGLIVGRNGLFFDRRGRDWDATVVKVVENPISIREAFWSPYKRVVRFIEDFIAKRAADADKESEAKLTSTATAIGTGTPKDVVPKKGFDVGTIAALGVGLGAITTAFGLVLSKFIDLGPLMPLGVLALILLVSLPSMVLAWLKLRARNLGPILDANGWAVNGHVRINIPFGVALTKLGRLPGNAHRVLRDPYAERSTPWGLYLVLAILVAAGGWIGWRRHADQRWIWQDAPVPVAAPAPAVVPKPAQPAATAPAAVEASPKSAP